MRDMRDERKLYFLKCDRTLSASALRIGLQLSNFSTILNGWREPRESERKKLKAAMSAYHYRKFFPRPKVKKLEGTEAVGK
jgi:hypothetical protein